MIQFWDHQLVLYYIIHTVSWVIPYIIIWYILQNGLTPYWLCTRNCLWIFSLFENWWWIEVACLHLLQQLISVVWKKYLFFTFFDVRGENCQEKYKNSDKKALRDVSPQRCRCSASHLENKIMMCHHYH